MMTFFYSPSFWWGVAGTLGFIAGFPNTVVQVPPLVLIFPVALFVLGVRAPSPMVAVRHGWLCGIAAYFGVLYWVALPLSVVGNLPWLLALPCALGVACCLAFACGLFALAAYRWQAIPPVRLALLLGIVWYGLEYAYALLPFPWLPLAAAFAVWPVCIQPAAVVGAYALSGILACFALLLYAAVYSVPSRMACAALCLTCLVPSVWRLAANPVEYTPQGADSRAVLFVEGNIDQNQKWDPAFQRSTIERYFSLTEQGLHAMAAAGQRDAALPPLVVWPETAMPFYVQAHQEHSPRLAAFVQKHAIDLLLGCPAYEDSSNKQRHIFNRAFLLGAQGRMLGHYDKQYLVPFGEYLPPWLDFEVLKPLLQGVGMYSQGTVATPLYSGNLAMGMLICYEAIFPDLAQKRVQAGATVLADISNDGWFGNTAAPVQHLYLTILRAVEQERWMLRGTNTGISAICDAYGRIIVQGGRDKAQSVQGRVRAQQGLSLFHRLYWYIPATMLLLFIALLCIPVRKKTL
ncbi:MAG: apolipoprotein N-acyltransferase [Desulfovibrionaceae bacterium]|nr:apolipoprotein N-acyltransferase [Desulfovibrionaceae bacterium]